MTKRLHFLTVSLALALLAVSCAPSAATESPAPVDSAPAAAPTAPTSEAGSAPTQAPAVQPIVTARGPDLHATDPTTVSLASGQYQLIEFFRFT